MYIYYIYVYILYIYILYIYIYTYRNIYPILTYIHYTSFTDMTKY